MLHGIGGGRAAVLLKAVLCVAICSCTIAAQTRIEAESIADRKGFSVASRSDASGGKLLEAGWSGATGAAALSFTGTEGKYDLFLTYWDEGDGSSVWTLKIDGTVVWTWEANEAPPRDGVLLMTKEISDLALKQGAKIEVGVKVDNSDRGRWDYLVIKPSDGTPAPQRVIVTPTLGPGAIDLSKLALWAYHWIADKRWLAASGTGSAWWMFAGPAGSYRFKVTCYDEADGSAPMALYVNSRLVSSWVLDRKGDISWTHTIESVFVAVRDTVRIVGKQNGDAHARVSGIVMEKAGSTHAKSPAKQHGRLQVLARAGIMRSALSIRAAGHTLNGGRMDAAVQSRRQNRGLTPITQGRKP